MEIVDGYAHCGLSKYHPIGQVRDCMRQADAGRAVLVQHLGEYDNSYIEGIVADDPKHFAGVGMVDSAGATAMQSLHGIAEVGRLKGIRFASDMLTSNPRLLSETVSLGLIILLYAPQGVAKVVKQLREFLDTHPLARLVLTHLGHPPLAESEADPYHDVFKLAEHPGVFYQLSGMKMFCPFPHDRLHSTIGMAYEHFGPSRIYWGSNYPVVGSAEDYRDDLNLVLEGRLPIPKEAIPAVVGGNARRLWFGGE